MSYTATVYRVLVASPSDVVEERRAIPEILQQWNRDNSFAQKIVLEAVKWETHCTPEMGDRPQEIVNRQVVRSCDILVGVFWTRLGSPTGKETSGTVEEIREFINEGKPVLLYFSAVPVALESVDTDQWAKLQAFKKECQTKGLFFTYENIDELRDFLRSHLSRTVEKLKESDGPGETAEVSPSVFSQVEKQASIVSLRYDFEAFLKKITAAWCAERDSEPLDLDDAKHLLRRAADELVEYRSRIAGDAGRLPALFAEATKQLKSLQRHEVFLDGGVSHNEFWQKGGDVLFLLGIALVLLSDALKGKEAARGTYSATQMANEEVAFNLQHLKKQEYSTPTILQTDALMRLLEREPAFPERLVTELRTHVQNIQAAKGVHEVTREGLGDFTPELLRIEELLGKAQTAGDCAIRDLQTLLRYLSPATT
jgi:hypothetical protein